MLRSVGRSRAVVSAVASKALLRRAAVLPCVTLVPSRLFSAAGSGGGGGGGGYKRPDDVIIPGTRAEYGSLGERPLPSRPAVAWQATQNIDVQRVTQKAIVYELAQQQSSTLEYVVPWFLETMPASYFRQVPERFRNDHIKAIAAVKDANMDLYLNLKSHLPDGRQVLTFIRPGTEPGTLLDMVETLPWQHNSDDYLPLTRILVFSSKDESMSLNMFVYGIKDGSKPGKFDVHQLETASTVLEYAELVQAGAIPDDSKGLKLEPSPLFERESMIDFLSRCSENYINAFASDPRRLLVQRQMFDEVSGTEGTRVHIEEAATIDEPGEQVGHYWVDVAVANVLPQVSLEHLCRLLYLHKFDVTRARLDVVSDGDNGNVTLLRMMVSPADGSSLKECMDGSENKACKDKLDLLAREMRRVKWLDPSTTDLVFGRYPDLGVTRGEIITGFGSLMHPIMSRENSIAYSKANILETITKERFMPISSSIADLFLERFNPEAPLSDMDFETRCQQITAAIESDVEEPIAKVLFLKMIDIVKHTLKTNAYMPDRYALGLRLDPNIMQENDNTKTTLPYGIVFVHGRRFNGFHVRFRDIARGGLRLVTPRNNEMYALESARHYDECYGLAFAQQLKNKDIPEGGSKAVCLIDTVGSSDVSKNFVMRKSVKAFVDCILDLIVKTDDTNANIVDLFGKKEVIYLGPDEQVIPEDINWVIQRAGKRGYDTPAAFMSSKPRAGINHKEYGVTSEGVNVFLDVALRRILGIDPTQQSFTLKITGGPDGDVAGNEMKILFREYGENAKIVGVADASGCAEDPEGLNHEELLRLFREGLSISYFNTSKLSNGGVVHTVDTPEGMKARNTMHNRLEADAFLPCGGRPGTIDMSNYKQFLKADGTPTSRLIVEGANLFITKDARKALFEEAGIVIVKDSSANKGGVITSSYEICAAMLLDEEPFFQNKAVIVNEVLEKLRDFAKLEATLLFREYESFGGSLPEVSEVISDCINSATDALSTALDTLSESDREALLPLFRAHLPKTLADLAFDEVHQRVPEQYIKNAISSCLASKLIYKEGTKFISAQPQDKLAAIALKYMQKEKEIAELLEMLKSSEIPEGQKEQIIDLLEKGGARTALGAF